MKSILAILLIAIAAAFGVFVLPWWVASIIACLVVYGFGMKPGIGFLAGFLGIGLVWAGFAGWTDQANHSLLSNRIGELFMGISSFAVILVTAMIGGISGGLGGITGALLASRSRKG